MVNYLATRSIDLAAVTGTGPGGAIQVVDVERADAAAGTLAIDASSVTQPQASYDLVKTMRASILVLGPLLARFGRRFGGHHA